MNKVIGYRKMLGYTQEQLADIFGISVQSYRMKEKGKVPFKKNEMLILKNELQKDLFPKITVDEIFFD